MLTEQDWQLVSGIVANGHGELFIEQQLSKERECLKGMERAKASRERTQKKIFNITQNGRRISETLCALSNISLRKYNKSIQKEITRWCLDLEEDIENQSRALFELSCRSTPSVRSLEDEDNASRYKALADLTQKLMQGN